MLIPLGIAFVVALFASTVIALTLTPVLCSYMLTTEKALKKSEKEPFISRSLKKVKLGTALQKNSDRYSCHPTGFIADHPIQFRT